MTSTHGNHGQHSNSGVSAPSFGASDHSVSIGTTFRTAFPDDTEKTALQILTYAVNDIRRALPNASKSSDATVPSAWNTANITNLLSYTKGTSNTYPRYKWGTHAINAHGNCAGFHDSTHTNTGHVNTSSTNNSLQAPSVLSRHCNVKCDHNASGHASTSQSYHLNSDPGTGVLQSVDTSGVEYTKASIGVDPTSTYNTTVRNSLLTALNKKLLQYSAVSSFPNRTVSHTNNISHGD